MPVTPPPSSAADRKALLGIYLNDHLAGATARAQLAHRALGAHHGSPVEEELRSLADEIDEDRASLVAMMRALDVPVRHYKAYAASLGELLGRLKLNGRWLDRSPLSTLVEFEALALATDAEVSCWRALRRIGESDDRIDPAVVDRVVQRAERRRQLLGDLRDRAVADLFGT